MTWPSGILDRLPVSTTIKATHLKLVPRSCCQVSSEARCPSSASSSFTFQSAVNSLDEVFFCRVLYLMICRYFSVTLLIVTPFLAASLVETVQVGRLSFCTCPGTCLEKNTWFVLTLSTTGNSLVSGISRYVLQGGPAKVRPTYIFDCNI